MVGQVHELNGDKLKLKHLDREIDTQDTDGFLGWLSASSAPAAGRRVGRARGPRVVRRNRVPAVAADEEVGETQGPTVCRNQLRACLRRQSGKVLHRRPVLGRAPRLNGVRQSRLLPFRLLRRVPPETATRCAQQLPGLSGAITLRNQPSLRSSFHQEQLYPRGPVPQDDEEPHVAEVHGRHATANETLLANRKKA